MASARWPRGILGLGAALLWLSLSVGADASAQTAQGESLASVHSLVLDPTAPATLYLATDSGVFKSEDSGESWRRASDGLPHSVGSLVMAPSAPDVLYVRTSAGFFRSVDGAASWSALEGFPAATGIVIDPQNSSRIFAVTPLDIFRSLDGGRTWERRPRPFFPAMGLVIDPKNPETLYTIAGIRPTLIYKSSDGGDTWTQATNGFPVGPRGPLVGGLPLIDPVTPSTLYAGSTIGFYKSLDGASQWFPINDGLPCLTSPPICPQPASFAVDPVLPARVYAVTHSPGPLPPGSLESSNVYRSTNGGGFWQLISRLGQRRVGRLKVDPSRPDRVFATTDRGVIRSEDAGASWTEASRGLPRSLRLLLGRFSIGLLATDPRSGRSATGEPSPVNDFFGFFSLTGFTGSPENPEVFVKMLDGRAINRHFWVFYGGLTDLEFTLTVTDTLLGLTRTYHKDFGSACGGFDTAAFREP